MTKKVLTKTNQMSRDEWLHLRRKGIGGSDAAAACGLSRYKSMFSLYQEKMGKVVPEPAGEAAYWGTIMEPVLRSEFGRRTGLTVEPMPYLFYASDHPFMIADIDGIVREKDGSVSLVEIKTANAYAAPDWVGGLPIEYYMQVQHYLYVCDLTHAYVVVLIGGNDFRTIELDRDPDTVQSLIKLESDFWINHVEKGTAPAVDGMESTSKVLEQLYPTAEKISMVLPESADELVSYYLSLQSQEKSLKTEKTAVENQLKELLKDNQCALTPAGYAVSWKNVTTNRLDTTALRKDHPDLVAQYTKAASSRRFSIKFTHTNQKGDK